MPHAVERWRIAGKVAYEFVREEAVVLNLGTGQYYRLNAVAARAWAELRTPRGMEEVSDQLTRVFEVDRETLDADLAALFEDFERLGLLIREP